MPGPCSAHQALSELMTSKVKQGSSLGSYMTFLSPKSPLKSTFRLLTLYQVLSGRRQRLIEQIFFTILSKSHSDFHLKVLETVHILTHKPSLCKQGMFIGIEFDYYYKNLFLRKNHTDHGQTWFGQSGEGRNNPRQRSTKKWLPLCVKNYYSDPQYKFGNKL